MDILSNELHNFLIQLGENSTCVSEKVEHYMKHILHLLTVNDETLLLHYYGLFGNQKMSLDELSHTYGISSEAVSGVVETCLRKLAVTPEWQMVKQFTQSTRV